MARYYALIAAADPEIAIGWASRQLSMMLLSQPTERLLDLLGTRYVLSRTELADNGITPEYLTYDTRLETDEITVDQPLAGTFTPRKSALNRLDVLFHVFQPPRPQGTLKLRLWRGTEPPELIAEEEIDPSGLLDGQVVTFYFAPERQAPGVPYRWEISVDSETGRSGVGLYSSESGDPAVSAYGATWAQVYQGETFLTERLAALPRAYVVYAADTIRDDALATAQLLSEEFDMRNVAVSAEILPLPTEPELPASPAQIISYSSTSITILAKSQRVGLLVLSDQFYPGWRASVNGKPAAITRVNQISRGVLLPAGDHEVVFSFQPASLRLGARLSLAGVLACIALLLASRFVLPYR
jgi:hypothetical protein